MECDDRPRLFVASIPKRVKSVSALSLCVLIVAACGGDDDKTDDPRSSAKPQFCPKGSDAYDASQLIGLDLEAAREEAKQHRCSLRVVEEDGEVPALHSDLRSNRINIEVSDGEVVRIDGIY